MLNVSRIRGICFDLDGTLSDTDDEFVLRLNRWLFPVGYLFPTWDSLSFARRVVMASETPATFLHILPDRFRIDGKISLIGDYLYRKGIRRSVRPFSLIPGIVEMLEQLSSRYLLGIVSSRGKMSVQSFLAQFNLGSYFASVVTAQTCERVKPHPGPILWAAKEMNITPQECLMVGDTTVDILAGRLAGAQTVGVLCGFGEAKELLDSGADLIVEATPDLVRFVL
jgi:phosphoglycolate phosphatase-like HAD superfamily hydrolase